MAASNIAIAAIHGDARYLKPILQTALDGLHPRGSPHLATHHPRR